MNNRLLSYLKANKDKINNDKDILLILSKFALGDIKESECLKRIKIILILKGD